MKQFVGTTTGRRVAAVVGGGAVALVILAVSDSLPDSIQDGLANAVDNVGVDLPGGENQLGTAAGEDEDGPVSFPDLEIEPSATPTTSATPSPSPRPYRRSSGGSRSYYDPYAETDDDSSYYNPYVEESDDDDTVYVPPPDSDDDGDSGAGYGQPGEGGSPGVPNDSNDNAGQPGEGGPGGAPGL